MKKAAVLLSLLSLSIAACATDDNNNRPDANHVERTFQSVDARLESTLATLGNVAPAAGTVSTTSNCASAGTIGLAGTYDDGNGFDLTATVNGCHDAETTLDGNLHWTSETDGTRIEEHWQGMLDADDGATSWSCTFDLSLIVDGDSVVHSGTICGYDVVTDLGW